MGKRILAILLVLGTQMFGQVDGRITGSIVDSSGAAMASARVTLTLPGSSVPVIQTVTTTAGLFDLIGIRADTYDLSVEAPGFTHYKLEGLEVNVARETALAPIKLAIAPLAASLDVAAQLSTETGNAEIVDTITHDQLESLPTLGRNPLQFLATEAGVTIVGSGNIVDGLRGSYTEYRLDGISVDDEYVHGSWGSSMYGSLLLDQVGEISVATANMSAALGGAAHVSISTPSGTNQYHGTGYWYNQNSAFASNTWSNNSQGISTVPPLNQNQAGVTFGGPILRDKLLFYANVEDLQNRNHVYFQRTILSDDARQGILTYQDAQGNVHKANILQLAGITIDPYIQKLLTMVPTGLDTFGGDSQPGLIKNTGGRSVPIGLNSDELSVIGKLDYIRSTRHVFSFSYLRNHTSSEAPGNGGYTIVPALTANTTYHLASAAWRWNPAPSFTNELRGGVSLAPVGVASSTQNNPFFLDQLLFTSPINSQASTGRRTTSAHFLDTAIYSHGKHNLQFGAEVQEVRSYVYNYLNTVPHYYIGTGTGNPSFTAAQLPGITTGDLTTANQLLAALGGFVTGYAQQFNVVSRTSGFVPGAPQQRHLQENNLSWYVQDTWKVSPRLTLTAALRYDYFAPVSERDGLKLMPVIQHGDPIATVLSNATIDYAGSLYKPDRNNFAPVLGAAWDPFGHGKTTFRAAYGIYYVNDQNLVASDTISGWNDGLSATSQASGLSGRVGTSLPTIPVPSIQVPRTAALSLATDSGSILGLINPNLRTPYVQQWNAGLQHTFAGILAEVRYVGNHGVKEWRAIDYDQVIIKQNGFLNDFLRAYRNGNLALAATGMFNPSYNAAISGSQPLTIFPTLPNGGFLTSSLVENLIQTGQVGSLAYLYQVDHLNGSVDFLPNPYAAAAYLLENVASSTYNALQVEARRRAGRLARFQFNYTFAEALTDDLFGPSQVQAPMLDMTNGSLEKARQPTDVRHSFRANAVINLPLGESHTLDYRSLRKILSGWSAATTVTKQSGLPFSILSRRGTLSQYSTWNTANTLLTGSELSSLFQFRNTPNGPYFVASSAIGPDGRAVAGDGKTPFPGQVFFEPGPGTVGTLQPNFLSGPWTFGMNASLMKVNRFTERQSVEVRIDAFNAWNHPAWGIGNQYIDSPTFGRLNGGSQRIVQLGLRYKF
jgi:hypothetical protein